MTPISLALRPDQEEFRQMAREVVAAEAPLRRFRAQRDAGATADPQLWHRLVALGWPALPFAEDHGGLGLSMVEVCLATEALGSTLAQHPLLSTVLVSTLDPEANVQVGAIVALAWQEDTRTADPFRIRATHHQGRLTGEKRCVLDAPSAESFVVSAWEGDRVGLFRVSAAHATVRPLTRIDHRDVGHVYFDNAPAEPLPVGLHDLQRALDRGVVALSAELLGGAEAAFAMTLSWLREREQFDAPIGSFQALQHRAVDLFAALELSRSAVLGAAAAEAAGAPNASALASLAKVQVDETALRVGKESIQMFGGIGMTDEHDIGLFYKRAAVVAETLGTAAFHRDRWGRLMGI